MTLLAIQDIQVKRAGSNPLSFSSFSLNAGEQALVLGPSGSGKTTLLSVMAGLLAPAQGNVTWKGADLYAMNSAQRDIQRGRDFGFVFQTLHLIPSLTLRQNVALAATMAGLPENRQRVDALLERLGLTGKAHRKPESLSHGEQQRGALARALVNRPAILLADEPTSALDDSNAEKAMDLLMEQARENGAALLVATHDSRIQTRFNKIIRLEVSQQVAE